MIGGAAQRITVEIGGKLGASLASSLRAAQTQVSSFSRNASRTFNDAALAGRSAFQGVVRNPMWQAGAVAAAGIGAGLVSATRVAVDFEKQMSSVAAKMGDATEAQLTQLGSLAKELGRTTKFTAGETAAAMDFLAMAGFKTNDILSATPGVLNLAAVGNMELAEAADIASNILGGMGLPVEKTSRLIDVLAKTATNGNTSVAQLGNAFKSVGPIARTAGASIEDVGASLAILGDRGIQAEEAGTALRNVFVRLAAPPTEAAKALQRLGVSTKNSAGDMRPFGDVLGDVDRRMKELNLGSAEQIGLQSDIFGLRALAAGQILQEASATGELATRVRTVTDSQGAAAEMARKMQDNLGGSLTRLGSAAEGFQLALAGPNSKVLQGFVDGLTGAISKVTELMEAFPELSGAVVLAGGAFVGLIAIAPFLASFIAVVKTLGAAVAAMKLGATIAGFAGLAIPAIKGIGAVFALLTGPVGLAVAAIIGIGAGLVWAYQNVEWFRNGVNGAMARVREIFAASLTAIKGGFEGFLNYIGGAWKVLSGILTLNPARIQEGFGQAFGGIKQMAGSWLGWMDSLWPGVQKGAQSAWAGLKGGASSAMEGVKGAFSGAVDGIKGAWTGITSWLSSIWSSVLGAGLQQAVNGVVQVFQGLGNSLKGIWNIIVGVFTGNSEQAVAGVRQAFAGLRSIFSGLSNMAQGAFGLLGAYLKTVWNGIRTGAQAAWNGIKAGAQMAWSAILGAAQSALNGIRSAASAVWAGVVAIAQGAWSAIVSAVMSIPGRIAGAWQSIKQGAINAFQQMVAFIKTLPDMLKDVGKAIIDTIINGIKSRASALKDTVKATFAEVRKMLPFSDAKEGPFKHLTASGKAIISTLSLGVNQASPLLNRAMHGAADGAMQNLHKATEGGIAGSITTSVAANPAPPQLTAAGVPVRSQSSVPQYAPQPERQHPGLLQALMPVLGKVMDRFAPQAKGLLTLGQTLANSAREGNILPSLEAGLGAAARSFLPQASEFVAPLMRGLGAMQSPQMQPALANIPAPSAPAGVQASTVNMSPTINVNVAGSNSSPDDIADQIMRAFQSILGDSEANVRAFLND